MKFTLIVLILTIFLGICMNTSILKRDHHKISTQKSQQSQKTELGQKWWFFSKKIQEWSGMKVHIEGPETDINVVAKIGLNKYGLILYDQKEEQEIKEAETFVKSATFQGTESNYLIHYRLIQGCNFPSSQNKQEYSFKVNSLEHLSMQTGEFTKASVDKQYTITVEGATSKGLILDFFIDKLLDQKDLASNLEKKCKASNKDLKEIMENFGLTIQPYLSLKSNLESTISILQNQYEALIGEMFPILEVRQEAEKVNSKQVIRNEDVVHQIEAQVFCDKTMENLIFNVEQDDSTKRQSAKDIVNQQIPDAYKHNLPLCPTQQQIRANKYVWGPLGRLSKAMSVAKQKLVRKAVLWITDTSSEGELRFQKRQEKKEKQNTQQKKARTLYMSARQSNKKSKSKGIGWFLASSIDQWVNMDVTIAKVGDEGVQPQKFVGKISIDKYGFKFYVDRNEETEKTIFASDAFKQFGVSVLNEINQEYWFLDYNQVDGCKFQPEGSGYSFTTGTKLNEKQLQRLQDQWQVVVAPTQGSWLSEQWQNAKSYFSTPEDNTKEINSLCSRRNQMLRTKLDWLAEAARGYKAIAILEKDSQSQLFEAREQLGKYLYPTFDDIVQPILPLDNVLGAIEYDYLCEMMGSIVINSNWESPVTGLETLRNSHVIQTGLGKPLCMTTVESAKYYATQTIKKGISLALSPINYAVKKLWARYGDYVTAMAVKAAKDTVYGMYAEEIRPENHREESDEIMNSLMSCLDDKNAKCDK